MGKRGFNECYYREDIVHKFSLSNFKIELRIPCCSKIIKTYFNLILSQLALKCIQKFFPGLIFSHRTRKIKRIFPHFFFKLTSKTIRFLRSQIQFCQEWKISEAHNLYDATLKLSRRSAIAGRISNNAPGFLFSSQLSGKHKTICEGSIFLMELKIIFNIFNVLI